MKRISSLMIFWLFSLTAFAQYPLDVRVTISPPYPIRLSDFTAVQSNMLVTIANSGTETYPVALVGTLRNEDTGATISSDINSLRGSCIDVPPGTRLLSGSDLQDLFNPDNLTYRGVTREQIRGDEALPEGNYTLCIRAMDCNRPGNYLSEIPIEPVGCSSFDVSYLDPPVIVAPMCDSEIPADANTIPVVWTQILPASGVEITYKLRIVEVEPVSRNPYDAILTSPPVFIKEITGTTSYNVLLNDDVILEPGRKYAFQITAEDPTHQVAFRNNGGSEICTFIFGSPLTASGTFTATASFPEDGDYLPFSFFPIITRYTPYDNAYNRFRYEFTINNDRGYHDNKDDELRWGFGPLESQRRATGFHEMTQEQAQHIALYKNQTELSSSFRFQRGARYTWRADIEVDRGSTTFRATIPPTTFNIGMSPSQLRLPENQDTIPAGDILFRWHTGREPEKIIPDFAITQARGSSPTTFFNGIVDERWVIEVSKSESFTPIINTIGGRLGYTVDLNSDPQTIKDELYKDLDEHFTITDDGKYYWRVRWMNAPDNISDNSSYATSEIFSFVITHDSVGTRRPEPEIARTDTTGACRSNCLAEVITDRTATAGLAVGANLTIGKFTLQVRTITSSSGNRYTGEGIISIPFLSNVKILTEFTNIQYNSSNKIFSGTVTAKEDRQFVPEEIRTRAGQVLSLSESDSRNLSGFLDDGERLVSLFSGSREIGMPIGIDREIDGHQYVIGIVNMEFTPERATLDAVMSLDFPEIGNRLISFGVKELCFSPGGLGDEGRLYLARDWVLVQEGETEFAFNGSESADTTQATYVSWDCHGFKCLQVRGHVTFPRSMLVPDNDDGTIGSGNVNGTFGVKACRGGNWIAMITIDPFQVNGLTGWGWNATNAYLDFSNIENPPGFRLPEQYGDTTLLDDRLVNTWQGFYMERVAVKLPPEFASDVTPDGRTGFGIEGIMIDATGLTASVRAYNILEVSEGNFEGWGFAIDTVNIDFVSNTFTEAGMAGRISLPIFEAGDNLKYKMALAYDDDAGEFSYQFRVFTRDTLNIPMWNAARMFFKPNSSIEIGFNDPVKGDHATAILNGGVHLVGDFGAIPGINFRGINFEGLYISTFADEQGRYFKADSVYIAHASPQKSASGFPVNIDNINLNLNDPTHPGIEFDFQLLFSEGSTSIGAEARFGIFARWERAGDGFNVNFDRVDVGRISIDVEVSVMRLQGELEFYNNDPIYGNGTRGNIRVELPMDISGELTAYFGTVGAPGRGTFGSSRYFSYWFVDGMVTFPGVPIFSGFAIYGIGGGAYHHMTMAGDLPDPQATRTGSGRTSVRYVPDANVGLGLKLAAVFGTHPSSDAFNMDVRLQAEFNDSFGLNFISVGGDGYFMASISERGDAKVWANVEIVFDNRPVGGPKFTGNFDVFVNVENILHGVGAGNKFVALELYIDKDTWHIYMGTPESRSGLVADLRVIQATLTTYLMVGHGIPVALPPLPDRVQSVLYGSSSELEGQSETTSAASSRSRSSAEDAAYRSGEGFAFGAALALDINLDFAIFYASLGLDLGFDLNCMKPAPGSVFCAETGAPPVGIDGWYIQGQVFAGLYGEMGVQIDLFFIKGRFPFIQLAAAAVMQGNFPDPSGFRGRAALQYSVLGGLVSGRCSFQMEIGQKCTFVIPNPLSGMEFIADIVPENGSNEQSCFSSPAVSFNLPVEELMEFPVTAADGSEVVRTFYPYVDSFTFKKRGATQGIRGSYSFESNNTELKFRLDEMLEGNTGYDVRIVIKAREHFSNGTQQPVRNADGSIWLEERSVSFTSGPVPDYIPLDQVAYTYPAEGQYYFLKGEQPGLASSVSTANNRSSGGKSTASSSSRSISGMMQLENPVNQIFRREIDGKQYRYLVRYIPVSGGDNTEIELTYSTGRVMTIPLPPNMENETMYGVQLVRKYIPPPVSALERAGREIRNATTRRLGISDALATAAIQNINLRADAGTANIRNTGKQLLPGETVGLDEKLLYKFYFRTSKYNTLRDKVAATNFTASYFNILFADGFNVGTVLDEPFDEFETNGLYKNGRQVMKPLLSLSDPWTYTYHSTIARPGIYDLHQSLSPIMNANYLFFFRYASFTGLNRHQKGIPPTESVTISDQSQVTGSIEEWQVEREARRNPDYNQQSTATTIENISEYTMAAGALNGSPAGFRGGMMTSSLITPSAPQPNFKMLMLTSTYVYRDFLDLKNSVSRAMAWSAGWPVVSYPIRDAINASTSLRSRVNTLLRQTILNYSFTHGTYGLKMQYRWPRGNDLYNTGSQSTKTFTY